jgi:hypothetical protein
MRYGGDDCSNMSVLEAEREGVGHVEAWRYFGPCGNMIFRNHTNVNVPEAGRERVGTYHPPLRTWSGSFGTVLM